MSEALQFPIGRFTAPAHVDAAARAGHVSAIAELPARLRAAVMRLRPAQLEMTYRPGGWTVRQVVHHVADSHMNAYIRCKLALTEERPRIKPYDEQQWATLADVASVNVEVSLALLEALHLRWVAALRGAPAEAYSRELVHPDHGTLTLDQLVAMYAWHGAHHVAHVGIVAAATSASR